MEEPNINVRLAWFCLISFAIIWISLFRINSLASPFESDEGEYAYSAQLLLDHGVPYKDAFMQKPPMIIYTYALGQTISRDVMTPRILALIFLILTALLVADIAWQTYGVREAFVFLFLFSPLVSFPEFSFSAQPEIFLILPLVGSWWCYFRWRKSPNIPWLIVLGFCLSVAIMFKQTILPACAFIAVYAIFSEGNLMSDFRRKIHTAFFLCTGGVIALTLIFFPIYITGGLEQMWEYAFRYNFYYASYIGLKFDTFSVLFFYVIPILCFGLWGIIKRIQHWIFFLGIVIFSLCGTFGSQLAHYYIILTPSIAFLGACGATVLIDELPSLNIPWKKYSALSILCIVSITPLTVPFISVFTSSPDNITLWRFSGYPFIQSKLMAKVLDSETLPSDTVFIWGSDPEILFYAQRKSATRFVIFDPLEIPTPYTKSYDNELMSELHNIHPKAIITTRYPIDDKFLDRPEALLPLTRYLSIYLLDYYTLYGGVVLINGEPHFILKSKGIPDVSSLLLLYLRK